VYILFDYSYRFLLSTSVVQTVESNR